MLERFKGKRRGIKSVSWEVDADEAYLIPFGDIHLGAPTCNIELLKGTLAYIEGRMKLTDIQIGIILMGDLLECATKTSPGASWVQQTLDPQEQLDAMFEALLPLCPVLKLLLEGNHEARIRKQTGLDIAKILANKLGIPYGGYSAFLRTKVRDQNYIIHAQHGSSNAWYPHTKLTAAMRTARHTSADIYLYGHTHELMTVKVPHRYYDLRSRTVREQKKYFVLTGSFLDYEGSYAEDKNLYPTKTGVAKIKLFGDRWDVHISV